jgi:hypothetical protein
MYKVIGKEKEQSFLTLESAMEHAKSMNEFVTIKSNDFEVCGVFGVDSVVNGKTPDGVAYTWNKNSRIGQMKRR